MTRRVIELRFPLAGVQRRSGQDLLGGERNEAYPTPWAVNMRPEDPISGRMRGGSRPGLSEFEGDIPLQPTGRLETETGVPIWTETGDQILMPITGSPLLYPSIMRALGAYGFAVLTDDIVATVGAAPTDPDLGCVWRDRLVLAKGGIVYMSRQGDWVDWDYGGDVGDPQRAVVLQPAEATERGELVTALIPHRDAYLLIATELGLWVLKGDPAADGVLSNVSRDVGIVSEKAWCKAGDAVFFLANDGLYTVMIDGGGLKNLSDDRLPTELRDIDVLTVDVMLGHDHGARGICLFLEQSDYHWYYDFRMGGFWPFTLDKIVESVFVVDGKMVFGDNVGQYWTMDGDDDAGEDVESHLLIGPLRVGSSMESGMILTLLGAIQTEQDGEVRWAIFVDDTAEGVAEVAKDAIEDFLAGEDDALDNVFASGIWSNGRSCVAYPRSRGMWQVLWLRSTDKWAYESVVAEVQKFGRWRP